MSGIQDSLVGRVANIGRDTTTSPSSAPAGAAGARLLPDPVDSLCASGDPGAMMAALIIKSAKEERSTSEQARDAEAAIQDCEERNEVAAMHAQADDIRYEGIAKGLSEVGSGALTVASGSAQVDTARAPTKAASDVFNGHAKSYDGAGRIASGVGELYSKQLAANGKEHEATAKMHEQAATHAKHSVDSSDDDVKDARELFKKALDFYHEYATSKAQADAAALHRS